MQGEAVDLTAHIAEKRKINVGNQLAVMFPEIYCNIHCVQFPQLCKEDLVQDWVLSYFSVKLKVYRILYCIGPNTGREVASVMALQGSSKGSRVGIGS